MRDRRAEPASSDDDPRAWIVREPELAVQVLILNESLWRTALREFAPVPIGSRIPYGQLPPGAVLLLEGERATAMGKDEAAERLAP